MKTKISTINSSQIIYLKNKKLKRIKLSYQKECTKKIKALMNLGLIKQLEHKNQSKQLTLTVQMSLMLHRLTQYRRETKEEISEQSLVDIRKILEIIIIMLLRISLKEQRLYPNNRILSFMQKNLLLSLTQRIRLLA